MVWRSEDICGCLSKARLPHAVRRTQPANLWLKLALELKVCGRQRALRQGRVNSGVLFRLDLVASATAGGGNSKKQSI